VLITVCESKYLCTQLASSNLIKYSLLYILSYRVSFKPLSLYRWDDESNGEIYTERTTEKIETGPNTNDVMSDNPLYVVENGREYRLVPLKQRRRLFELLNGKKDDSSSVGKKDKTKTKSEQKKIEKAVGNNKSSSSDRRENENGIKTKVKVDKNLEEKEVKTNSSGQTVKSLNVPYIVEEQEILQNIHIVKSVKNIFLKQNANKK